MTQPGYFQRGFGLKDQVRPELRADYHSSVMEKIKESDFRLQVGDLTFLVARELGFSYGVERAVEYAYEARRMFPDRAIYLTGEIIHNPHVNAQLREMGIRFLGQTVGDTRFDVVRGEDVVILPAFGVGVREMAALRARGCTLVDTTCGSVLNVWKNVDRFSAMGFTAIIHGKYAHEETRATASRTTQFPGGRYLVVRDREEASLVCDYIRSGGDPQRFRARFAAACSEGFDPDLDLGNIGLANQTTMLSSESLAIQEMIRQALVERFGQEELASRFQAFDTICSATQDRQDAIIDLIAMQPDLMVVIGGYNSSNTTHLAALASRSLPTYHIEDASCIDASGALRHKPYGASQEVRAAEWLPGGPARIGLTAGASTPNNKIGEVVIAVAALRGHRFL
jgi:4-hydroxy-3-methylbut-2-enyl diphosphate reductase